MISNTSLNNRLIVEVYQKEALRPDTSKGFAYIGQKNTLKGLTVLVYTKLSDGTVILPGYKAYIKEEVLHSAPWAQKAYNSESLPVPFLIVEISQVEFVSPPV